MPLLQTEIFRLAERNLAWASERQAVLASNIANLSTPGYHAKDLPDFQQVLSGTTTGIQPVRTAPNHLAGTVDAGMTIRPLVQNNPTLPDKNSDRLEEQLMKVADTATTHATVTAIFKKYIAMFNEALGKA